jgi:mRNA interferase MazF
MARPVLQRGDVVLVTFPFTDLTGTKVRPAVIVSANPQTEDMVVAFISTVIPPVLDLTDYRLDDQHPDFHQTGLRFTSVFRLRKLMTLERHLIRRRLSPRETDNPGRVRRSLEASPGARLIGRTAVEFFNPPSVIPLPARCFQSAFCIPPSAFRHPQSEGPPSAIRNPITISRLSIRNLQSAIRNG